MKAETKYVFFLTAAYFAISLAGALHHELWLDEAQHWLLARDSTSIVDLFGNTRLEGHPLLWDLMLYGITRVTNDVFWMQLLHILISTSAVFVFLWKAPFSLTFKTLFIFGYFIVYEYNIISRNYIPGILFLFLAASIFKERRQKFTLLCVFLAFAANVHLMFSVIAFAFFLTLLFENLQQKQLFQKQFLKGYGFFGIGLIVLYLQISGTNSAWFFSEIHNLPIQERFSKGFIALFKGLMTLPDFRTIHFWNSNIFVNWSKPITAVFGLLVYVIPFILFSKSKKTLFFVYTALIGTQFFFFITQRGATRFDGMTYTILIIALWMNCDDSSNTHSVNFSQRLAPLKKTIVYGILSVQSFSGICAYVTDWNHPFTASKDAAAYLKSKNRNNESVISLSCESTALAAYLEEKVFFLSDGNFHSYCQWDIAGATIFSDEVVLGLLSDYLSGHKRAIFISRTPLNASLLRNNGSIVVTQLQKFENNVLSNGNYYIFEVSRNLKINWP